MSEIVISFFLNLYIIKILGRYIKIMCKNYKFMCEIFKAIIYLQFVLQFLTPTNLGPLLAALLEPKIYTLIILILPKANHECVKHDNVTN